MFLIRGAGLGAQCFVRSANVRAKPELARGVRGMPPPENFGKTDAPQSERIYSTMY